MSNPLDRLIAWVSPHAGLRRAHARRIMSYYEAAKPSRLRKARREGGSPDSPTLAAGASLREQARHLEQNHDLARGVLSVLTANVVGPAGIGTEPQPRTRDGKIHDDLARDIERLWRAWAKRPEVTWRHDWASAQRIMARAWFRDGEALAQHLTGPVPLLDHGTRVPFSIELMETDYLPFDYNSDTSPEITQGVERNAWGRPVAYHLLKRHPGDMRTFIRQGDTKRVSAARMIHLALVDRIRQARGVSVFASILSRMEDLKDYEESERIAAKVAASMAAYIKKGTPDLYNADTDEDGDDLPRDMRFRPGMVFDDLLPGEDIGTIDTTRPNAQLEPHRKGQLRAAAAGAYCTYSSLAKDYNGTYSSQRQELVEGYGVYGYLSAEFISQFVRPVYEKFVQAALLSGDLVLPGDVDPDSVTDALYIPPQMPWIDPKKEAEAWVTLESAGYASGPEIVRKRGQNPRDVLDQEALWRREAAERGLVFTATADDNASTDNEEDTHDGYTQRSA